VSPRSHAGRGNEGKAKPIGLVWDEEMEMKDIDLQMTQMAADGKRDEARKY
jgi:hypothetical protein